MARLVLQLLVGLLTFSIGVVANRILMTGPTVTIASDECVTTVAQVDSAPVVPDESQLHSTAAAKTSVLDYDPKKFMPDGSYYLINKPAAFGEIGSIELWTYSTNDGDLSGAISPGGSVELITNPTSIGDIGSLSTSFALVTEKRLLFVTKSTSEDQFQYRFDGTFLRGGVLMLAPQNRAVLKGTLTKLRNGRKIAEHEVRFRIEYHGC